MSDDETGSGTQHDDPSPGKQSPMDDLLTRLGDDPSDVASLVGHFYRGEMDRTSTWRTRLDQTTNWAVIVVVAILTWVFSNPENPHYVLLLGMLATALFLLIEAHRFREYDVWRTRIRVIQEVVFSRVFGAASDSDRNRDRNHDRDVSLGPSLDDPAYTMSFWHAIAHRLRRVYLGLGLLLFVAWLARVTVYQPNRPIDETAALPGIPGTVVLASVLACYAIAVVVAVLPLAFGSDPSFKG